MKQTNIEESHPSRPAPHVLLALIPVVFLIANLWISLVYYSKLELTPHVPLILATVVASVIAMRMGYSWSYVQQGMVRGINLAMNAILILIPLLFYGNCSCFHI